MLFRTKLLILCFSVLSLLSTATFSVENGAGKYMHHSYNFQNKNGMTTAIFKPYLPRDDTIVIGAMLELVNVVYGKHQIENLKPSVVNKNGKNIILFRGVKYDYMFLLVKQDSGLVNAISMWREKRA